jgi:hypothetical protein
MSLTEQYPRIRGAFNAFAVVVVIIVVVVIVIIVDVQLLHL